MILESLKILPNISALIQKMGTPITLSHFLALMLLLSLLSIISYTIYISLKHHLLDFLHKKIKKYQPSWNKLLVKYNITHRLCLLVFTILIYVFIPIVESNVLPFTLILQLFIQKICIVYTTLLIGFLASSLLNVTNDVYNTSSKIANQRPIKSYIDVIKIVIWILIIIFIVSAIIDSSPVSILTGLGALSAVSILVFRDPIIGFVSSIQLAAYDIIRIGDCVKIKNQDIEGLVIDISLNAIKIQNFDKTIVAIPTSDVIKNFVINFRGMKEAGGRRIKRSIYIDINSIQFCDATLRQKLEKFGLLTDYLKENNLSVPNKIHNDKGKETLTHKGTLTNAGLFRHYIQAYLMAHTGIRKDFTLMVRHLAASEVGLPIEIYAFTYSTDFKTYEAIQAELFDHLFAILPMFKLQIFQNAVTIQSIPINKNKTTVP